MSTATWSTGHPARWIAPSRAAARALHAVPSAPLGVPSSGTSTRLRLTARGRSVLLFLAAAPLVLAAFLFALNGGGATASREGSNVPIQYVTVQSGESLWQLAEDLAPSADPRDVIAEIVSFNQLGSADVYAGQQLAVPTQYTR